MKSDLDNGTTRARSRRGPIRLTPREQFYWGMLGGGLILVFRLWMSAKTLPVDFPWPNATCKMCLLCGVWLAFPVISGLVSRALEPHSRLHALVEGAAAPALFMAVAKDFPL
jgi:hypothetical protein